MLNWISSNVKLNFFLNLIVWYKFGFMVLTWTHGMDLETWYREGLKVQTWSYGIDLDLWYRIGYIIQRRTHGIDLNSWYRLELLVQTRTHGIVSVLLNHTRTRGPSVTRMRDLFLSIHFGVPLLVINLCQFHPFTKPTIIKYRLILWPCLQ